MNEIFIEMSKDWNHKYDSLLIAFAMSLKFPKSEKEFILRQLVVFPDKYKNITCR